MIRHLNTTTKGSRLLEKHAYSPKSDLDIITIVR